MIIEIGLVIFIIANVIGSYIIWNLYIKCDRLEQWVDSTYLQIQDVLQDMKNLDTIGAFESDDEVGATFKALQETLNKLDTITEE
jgi:hypothetical protein